MNQSIAAGHRVDPPDQCGSTEQLMQLLAATIGELKKQNQHPRPRAQNPVPPPPPPHPFEPQQRWDQQADLLLEQCFQPTQQANVPSRSMPDAPSDTQHLPLKAASDETDVIAALKTIFQFQEKQGLQEKSRKANDLAIQEALARHIRSEEPQPEPIPDRFLHTRQPVPEFQESGAHSAVTQQYLQQWLKQRQQEDAETPPQARGSSSRNEQVDDAFGSRLHRSSACKPCLFWYKGLCFKGSECTFCHIEHSWEQIRRIRPSKKTRVWLQRRIRQLEQQGEDVEDLDVA
jgi:hypothetical protein